MDDAESTVHQATTVAPGESVQQQGEVIDVPHGQATSDITRGGFRDRPTGSLPGVIASKSWSDIGRDETRIY